MTTNPAIPEITPLEDRAIRRFELFHIRCYAKAKQLEQTQPDDDLGKRLQDAMRALQEADETFHDDASIVRGARYIGLNLIGTPYDLATAAEQEGLKAAARQVLAAVEGSL